VYLDLTTTGIKWLKETWVKRLKNLSMFNRVEDDLLWGIEADISPKYMGDDIVLLLGLTDDRAQQMVEEEIEGGVSSFHSLEKWNPKLRPGCQLTWVNCWGIPLVAWDTEQIRKIVVGIGEVVDVDDDVEMLRRLDRARVLIKTPWKPLIQHTVNVHIQGEVYGVHLVEEGGICSEMHHCRRGSEYGSSEEIETDVSDVGMPLKEDRRRSALEDGLTVNPTENQAQTVAPEFVQVAHKGAQLAHAAHGVAKVADVMTDETGMTKTSACK